MNRVVLAALLACAVVSCTSPVSTAPTVPGDVTGQVFSSTEVPASNCLVVLEGTPHSGRCDDDGRFEIRDVPAGRWNVLVYENREDRGAPRAKLRVGVNPRTVSQLDDLKLAAPGRIAGRVKPMSAVDLATSFVVSEDVGAITIPNAQGAYLLDGVSPGQRSVVLLSAGTQVDGPKVAVLPQRVTTDVDFDLDATPPGGAEQGSVTGVVKYESGGAVRLKVEALDARDGTILAVTEVGSGEPFLIKVNPVPVLIRARIEGQKPVSWVPPILVRSKATLEMTTSIVVANQVGDLDGDGLPNESDPDLDGDGIVNVDEATETLQWDPSDWRDVDQDGISDRFDLLDDRTRQTPAIDSDADARFDFEDNCPLEVNVDQADDDHDGVGNMCDQCPGLDDNGPLCPFPTAESLIVATPEVHVAAGACSNAVELSIRDRNGRPTMTLVARALRVIGAPADLHWFADTACTRGFDESFPANQRTVLVYFRSERAVRSSISLAGSGLFEAPLIIDVSAGSPHHVGFTQSPVRVESDTCSAAIRIAAVDRFANRTALNVEEEVVFEPGRSIPDQSGSPSPDLGGNFQFGYFSDPQCLQLINGHPSTAGHTIIPADGGTTQFYVRRRMVYADPDAGTDEGTILTGVHSSSLPEPTTQAQVIFPSRPVAVMATGPTQSGSKTDPPATRGTAAGGCSREIVFRLRDVNHNPQSWPTTDTVNINTSGGTLLFRDPLCTSSVPLVNNSTAFDVTPGQREVRVYASADDENSHNVQLCSGRYTQGCANTSVQFFSTTPTKIVLTREDFQTASLVVASELCSPNRYRVTLRDGFDNEATTPSDVAIDFSSTNNAFTIVDDSCNPLPGGTSTLTALTGSRSIFFRLRSRNLPLGTASEVITLTARQAQGGPLGSSTLAVTSLSLPDRVVITSPLTMVPVGTCTQVQLQPQRNGQPITVGANVDLGLGGPETDFRDDAQCLIEADRHLPLNSTSRTIFISMRRAGTAQLNTWLSYAGLIPYAPWTSPSFTVQPGAPTRIVIVNGDYRSSSAGNGVESGSCVQVSVQAQDSFGNPVPAMNGAQLNVAMDLNSVTGVTRFASENCTTGAVAGTGALSVPFNTIGVASFSVASTRAENNKRVILSTGSFAANLTWSISAGNTARISLRQTPTTIARNTCQRLIVEPTDPYGNLRTTGEVIHVAPQMQPGVFAIFADDNCTVPYTTNTAIDIPAWNTDVVFSVQALASGAHSLLINGNALTPATWSVTVQ